jgi:hypothetical protein
MICEEAAVLPLDIRECERSVVSSVHTLLLHITCWLQIYGKRDLRRSGDQVHSLADITDLII